jgi:hypothetical protein
MDVITLGGGVQMRNFTFFPAISTSLSLTLILIDGMRVLWSVGFIQPQVAFDAVLIQLSTTRYVSWLLHCFGFLLESLPND